jgi:hypothetical protein
LDIPPKVAIRASIRPGSVYYFPHESLSSPDSHFFIVINIDPIVEDVIILVCSSSKINKVKKRNRNNPPETIIEISKQQYADFTCDSVINCNNVFPERIDKLIERLSNKKLKLKAEMDISLVDKLRMGVLASRQIPLIIKQQLGMKIPS